MKFSLTPTCNREFISTSILKNKRIDGRTRNEFRSLSIAFGIDYGNCVVSLGNTRVLASVSSEIVEPTINRPCEGVIKINFDMSPMASPDYEHGKINDQCIEVQRFLEKAVKDSKSIDLESLCLIAGEKVWSIKVDLILLNSDGNLCECSSIALTTALLHFKRPDVSVIDDQLHIHTFEEKHPLSLNLMFYPFCSTLVFYENNLIVCDPNEAEEEACKGYLMIGTNNFKEINALHITGKAQINKDIVLKCCGLAHERSTILTNLLKKKLDEDIILRTDESISNNKIGYVPHVEEQCSALFGFSRKEKIIKIEVDEFDLKEDNKNEYEFEDAQRSKMYRFASDTIVINEQETNEILWEIPKNLILDEKEKMDDEEIIIEKEKHMKIPEDNEEIDDDDIEEEPLILENNEFK